jgi:hypothetical protein
VIAVNLVLFRTVRTEILSRDVVVVTAGQQTVGSLLALTYVLRIIYNMLRKRERTKAKRDISEWRVKEI